MELIFKLKFVSINIPIMDPSDASTSHAIKNYPTFHIYAIFPYNQS